jgi:hypothetical protein
MSRIRALRADLIAGTKKSPDQDRGRGHCEVCQFRGGAAGRLRLLNVEPAGNVWPNLGRSVSTKGVQKISSLMGRGHGRAKIAHKAYK